MGAVCGPIAGPVIGGFAAEGMNWRWPALELLWISGFAFVVLFFTFPETLESTILIRRAERLRKLTGNDLIKTRFEVENPKGESILKMGVTQIKMAFRLSAEPIVFFCNLYIGLLYCASPFFHNVRPSSSLRAASRASKLTFSNRPPPSLLPPPRHSPSQPSSTCGSRYVRLDRMRRSHR